DRPFSRVVVATVPWSRSTFPRDRGVMVQGCIAGGFFGRRKAARPNRPAIKMASEDGSGTGSNALKPESVIFAVAGVNGLVLLSALPSAVKVPLKVVSVLPLPKAYAAATTSLLATSWENSNSN